ncbi:MAG: hypothetical protein AVDCRST_MAG59-2717 [uncultured Thermomicrobiales bacterium]|uniref:Uncharacterized protein n=1 Tax=uncultured Thermomicrobiales bacterium TaxID=1645740 RepID=A0A6J4UZM8_9BACT|nr:MAG: hypothetical protein AVDCRST_MAG59-2717 [uncultured Thermomicrobiales bacterium]
MIEAWADPARPNCRHEFNPERRIVVHRALRQWRSLGFRGQQAPAVEVRQRCAVRRRLQPVVRRGLPGRFRARWRGRCGMESPFRPLCFFAGNQGYPLFNESRGS